MIYIRKIILILKRAKPNHNVRVESGLILGCELIRTLVTLVCFGDKGLIPGKKRELIPGYNI
jgi:hypothetical protein